jgi:hypothetical protein
MLDLASSTSSTATSTVRRGPTAGRPLYCTCTVRAQIICSEKAYFHSLEAKKTSSWRNTWEQITFFMERDKDHSCPSFADSWPSKLHQWITNKRELD